MNKPRIIINDYCLRIQIAFEKAANFVDIKKAYLFVFFYSLAVLMNRIPRDVVWGGDSQGYIENSVIRPPIYPLILDIFAFFFSSYEFIALVCFQLLFVLASAFYLSNLLRTKFELHPITFVLLYFFLSLPLSSASAAVGIFGGIGNQILTEAISYGLFLFAVSFLVQTLFSRERRNFLMFLLLIGLSTLIRTQMIFLYVIAAALILYFFWKDNNIRRISVLVLAVIAVFLVADLSERLYHKAANNYFGKISLNASHILVGAIYTSDDRLLRLIADKRDREVLKRTYAYLETKKLLSKNRFEIERRLVDIYNDNFTMMLNKGLMASFQDVYSLHPGEDKTLIQLESFSRRVLPSLVLHDDNYKDFSKLMLLKFLYSLNFREGFFMAAFLFFPFIRLRPEFKIMASFVLLMVVIVRLIMTPIIHFEDRYLLYTDILEYAILIIMAEQYIKERFGAKVFVDEQKAIL